MSQSNVSSASAIKLVLGSIGVLVFFGFLALILSGYAGHETLAERTYRGEFDETVTAQRWANLEEVQASQAGALDKEKVAEALAVLARDPAPPAKTEIVVPGSPTFLKQMQAPAEEAPAEEAPAEEAPAEEAPAEEAPAEEAPAEAAPAEEAPAQEAPAEAPAPEPQANPEA